MNNWNKIKNCGWPQKEDGYIKILSIDGGGIRGIFPARYLAHIEDSIGCKIHEFFDLIVGTSTGGIIALALSIEIPAKEVEELYINHAKDIFKPKFRSWLLGKLGKIFTPTYDNKALTRLLQERFENKLMHDAQTMLCIPSLEHNNALPKVYKTPHNGNLHVDANIPMWKVALATSAAPTYFPPACVNNDCKLDGGLWANNPVLVGISEAINNKIPMDKIKILSIGTGENVYTAKNEVAEKGGLIHWKAGLVDLAMNAQSYSANNMASYLLPKENFIRINFSTGYKLGLDSVKDADLKLLKHQADEQFAHNFVSGVKVKEVFFSL